MIFSNAVRFVPSYNNWKFFDVLVLAFLLHVAVIVVAARCR